jgi:hypothetical protein
LFFCLSLFLLLLFLFDFLSQLQLTPPAPLSLADSFAHSGNPRQIAAIAVQTAFNQFISDFTLLWKLAAIV